MDTHDGRGTTTLDPRQRIRDENTHRTHVDTAVLLRLVMSGQTQSVDDETDVNSADLQGFVRSELGAASAGIDGVSQRFVQCLYSRRVLKIGECGKGIVLCPGSVDSQSCSPRQDEGQERREG